MLTEAQQRVVTIGLRQIELELTWIEQLLALAYDGVLVFFVDDLTPVVCQRLREHIQAARERIRAFRDSFGLEPECIAKSRWIGGRVPGLWVMAVECQPRHLRGYGDVTPEAATRLDPLALQLAETLYAMEALLGSIREAPRAS